MICLISVIYETFRGIYFILQELYLRFVEESLDHNRDPLLLTAAVPGSKEFIDKGYDVPRISQ